MSVKIKKLRENFIMPAKAHHDDACFDLFISHIEFDISEGKVTCYLGFATEIPYGFKGVIVPRSSITKTYWVMQNSPGQIDAGYRGEWMVKFHYVGGYPLSIGFPFSVGDRVAQCYFEEVSVQRLELVDELIGSERGEKGFGGTGR